MKKQLTLAAALVGLFCSLQVQAGTTWIPIAVGDITTIIPYSPSGLFQPPANTRLTTVNGVSTLSWDDVKHASQYQIQALNTQGQWVTITTTEKLSLALTGSNASYSSFRVVACNYNTCANTGSWSTFEITLKSSSIIYKYDARGRLIKVSSSMGKEASYGYDDAGNRTTTGSVN